MITMAYAYQCDECPAKEAPAPQRINLINYELPRPSLPEGWQRVNTSYGERLFCPNHRVLVKVTRERRRRLP